VAWCEFQADIFRNRFSPLRIDSMDLETHWSASEIAMLRNASERFVGPSSFWPERWESSANPAQGG
jgi:hypothetical protein